jgi:hypothetical protein
VVNAGQRGSLVQIELWAVDRAVFAINLVAAALNDVDNYSSVILNMFSDPGRMWAVRHVKKHRNSAYFRDLFCE